MTEKNQPEENQPYTPPAPLPNVSVPWGMFSVAVIFDIIGLIPVLNIFTETLAGLIFGQWQKNYAPKTDPLITFIVAKIMDVVSLGILPSNIGIVAYAYIKKKAAAKITAAANTRLGSMAANRMVKAGVGKETF